MIVWDNRSGVIWESLNDWEATDPVVLPGIDSSLINGLLLRLSEGWSSWVDAQLTVNITNIKSSDSWESLNDVKIVGKAVNVFIHNWLSDVSTLGER